MGNDQAERNSADYDNRHPNQRTSSICDAFATGRFIMGPGRTDHEYS